MHSQIIRRYLDGNQKHFHTLISGDWHIGSKATDKKKIKEELDRIYDLDGIVLTGGDLGEFILPKDKKRYNASSDKYHSDNHINDTIEEIIEFIRPYKHLIKMIGCGNHETALSKHNSIDPTKEIIKRLNAEGADIQHGQYTGFIKLVYQKGKTKSSGSINRIIYYNHGQGGAAEVTKGMIDLNRFSTTYEFDLCWVQHKHQKILAPDQPVTYMDKKGNIKEKTISECVTGSYKMNANQYDALKEGYKCNFGEEKCRTNQSRGGYFITHYIENRNKIHEYIST